MARTWTSHPPLRPAWMPANDVWDRRLRHCPGRRFRSADSYRCYALGLIEKLRDDLRAFDGAKDELYFRIDRALRELANPNLHEVNLVTAFKIELWDRYGRDHLRMIITATSSSDIAHAAVDAAVAQYSGERLTLRKGAMVLRQYGKVEPSSSVTR